MSSGTCTWTADLAPFTTDTDSLGTIAMGNRKRCCQFAQVKKVQEAVNKRKLLPANAVELSWSSSILNEKSSCSSNVELLMNEKGGSKGFLSISL